jgi:hypothetical protein
MKFAVEKFSPADDMFFPDCLIRVNGSLRAMDNTLSLGDEYQERLLMLLSGCVSIAWHNDTCGS